MNVVHSAQAVSADVAKALARMTPQGRKEMVHAVVDGGMTRAAAARKFNTTPKTVDKWVKRFRAEGVEGLRDRSSRPLSPVQTPQATCEAIELLHRQRYAGTQIAGQLGGPSQAMTSRSDRGASAAGADPARATLLTLMRERPCLCVLATLLYLSMVAGTAAVDIEASLVLVALPLIPFAIFASVKGAAAHRSYGPALAVIVIIALSASFRRRDYADKEIDLQVAVRIVAIGALFALSMLSIRPILRHVDRHGLACWLSFLVYLILTCLYAANPIPALVAAASLLGAFLFACHLCVRYGVSRAIDLVVMAGTILFIGSLATYLAVPSLGRMSDWIGSEFVITWRLQGLFGSSNAAGMSGAVGLFLAWAFYAREPGHSRILAWIAVTSAFACMILSNNRMAIVAFSVCAALHYVLRRSFAPRVLLVTAITLLGAAATVVFGDRLLAIVSRSGRWEEIMSATGRARIWPVVLDLWSQTPMLGRGFGSALYILPTHPDLFLAAAHAHNLYLEQLFSGGLVGLGLFSCSVVVTAVVAWRVRAEREWSLLMFFFIYGLTEPVISGPVTFPIMVMFVVVAAILGPRPVASVRSVRRAASPRPSEVDGGQVPENAPA